MSKVDLTNIRWVLDRIPAIRGINKVQGTGLQTAIKTFDKIDKLIEHGVYSFEKSSEDFEFTDLLYRLRIYDIIDYDEVDYEAQEQEAYWAESRKKYDEAKAWLATLSEEEQAMVKVLQDSVRTIIVG